MLRNRKSVSFRIGLVIAAVMAVMALVGYVWTPCDPTAIVEAKNSWGRLCGTCSAPTTSGGTSSAA